MPIEYIGPLFLCWLFFTVCCLAVRGGSLSDQSHPKLRRHLAQGPFIFLASFVFMWVVQQFVLVHESEQEIVDYIYNGGDPVETPRFKEHLVLWSRRCGNANEGLAYALYGEAAGSGINDPDPKIRARSLNVTLGLLNGSINEYPPKIRRMIDRAEMESDPVFQQILILHFPERRTDQRFGDRAKP